MMGIQDFFQWRSTTTTPAVDDEVPADVDEPPDHKAAPKAQELEQLADFHKSIIRPINSRKESLLTRALHKSESEEDRPTYALNEMARRRSMLSNASMASTAELTSDGGLTSPARTNTPSPPPPSSYMRFATYSLAHKTTTALETQLAKHDSPEIPPIADVTEVPVQTPIQPKKRCISFACGGATKPKPAPAVAPVQEPPVINAPVVKRPCKISFACGAPKATGNTKVLDKEKAPKSNTAAQSADMLKPSYESPRRSSRSPSAFKKSPRSQLTRPSRTATTSTRPSSRSPISTRVKPKYIIADETTLDSEATRFHEFASGKVEEDDWIRREENLPKARLTINDTLKKENAIRQLGVEAEEEALEEEEDEDDEENEDEDEDDDDDEEDEDVSDEFSDGNETDNEAGFAESDESDGEGEFDFWAPGRRFSISNLDGASTYRPSAHRTASTSSIDSLDHMSPVNNASGIRRSRKEQLLKIRPGTPDLPDSTDFVCGTLDEDRPLEDAYKSCMEARKHAKHKRTPQDIDPSFPTSDIDDEEDDEDLVDTAKSSDENVWMQGKFEEDSESERVGRRGSRTARRKSPLLSPAPQKRLHSPPPPKKMHSPPPAKRLHSPPPPTKRSQSPTKARLRSPPPRRLFGHSPRRMNSPTPARHVASPAASPTSHNTSTMAIPFVPLGSRPGLTHTKSLPRAPNVFCRQYRAAQLAAANGNDGNDENDGHRRGAIDIVKGLEHKRQRRKEKFHQKHAKAKGHVERRPQPGKGAERMRELGLLMAGKTGRNDPYILSA